MNATRFRRRRAPSIHRQPWCAWVREEQPPMPTGLIFDALVFVTMRAADRQTR